MAGVSSDVTAQTKSPQRVTRHRVRDNIQQMILSGERHPGSKLRQQELAERFGVAQGVVREALLELQGFGLVETIDNRGIYVSRLDKTRLLEAFAVREVHEGLAARLCCERATRTDIRELMGVAEEIYSLGAAGKPEEMGALDRELHSRLMRMSGNSMLIRLADNYRILGKFVHADRDIEAVRNEHLTILQKIQDGDCEQAEHLMRQHVAAARLTVEERLTRGEPVPPLV
jgi:DNA-binding GntR family transcriptional regulator